jgi:hypothetical protein
MSVEGIFRKNGNIRRLKDDSEALDQDPGSVNFTEENPVQLAALLKKFLRDMPEPLLTFRLYKLLCQSQSAFWISSQKLRRVSIADAFSLPLPFNQSWPPSWTASGTFT